MSNFEISYPSDEQLEAEMWEDMLWEAENPLTPAEQAYLDRAESRLIEEEAVGEMYASRYAFDEG